MPIPNWLGKEETVKDSSTRQEKAFAKRSGGKRQPASGALDLAKGDVKLDRALGDMKETKAKSYRITSDTWSKIKREALEEGKPMAFLQIEMRDTPPLVVIEEAVFLALLAQEES